jgi:tetratricopeptide (TPR) repeat protein
LHRGLALEKLREYDKAIHDYDNAIKINPKYVVAYILRGFAKFSSEDYHNSINDYNKAIELNPNIATAYVNRGLAKLKMGASQKPLIKSAITDFSKAIELNPNLIDAYINIGIALYDLGEYQSAYENWVTAKRMGYVDADRLIDGLVKHCRKYNYKYK